MRKSDKLWEIFVARDHEERAALIQLFSFPHTRPEMDKAVDRKTRAYRKWSKQAALEQGTAFPVFPKSLAA